MVDVDDSVTSFNSFRHAVRSADLVFFNSSIMLFEFSLHLVDRASVRTEIEELE